VTGTPLVSDHNASLGTAAAMASRCGTQTEDASGSDPLFRLSYHLAVMESLRKARGKAGRTGDAIVCRDLQRDANE